MDHLFRKEYGKVVSYLTKSFGLYFLETAQDIAQDTLAEAYQNWSYNGLPDNPPGWIFKVAKNKALNWVKREQKRDAVYQGFMSEGVVSIENTLPLKEEIQDSMLQMIFACCRTEIAIENQIALILNILCGFSRKEIARALLTKEETIKKRLFRAKKQIREGKLISKNFENISNKESKIKAVCLAIYLLFNEGYHSSSKEALIRKDLCFESIRLTKLLLKEYKTNTRLSGLLSTMCFHVARFEARIDDKGAIVLLQDQNRLLWNKDLIKLGFYYLSEASKGNQLTAYHLEASIAAQHCLAKSLEDTNWPLIRRFYQQLYQLKPSPVILLNLAIISGILDGPALAIQQLEQLKKEEDSLRHYFLLYAVLGHFYQKDGNKDLAIRYFEKAKSLTSIQKEINLINNKMKKI